MRNYSIYFVFALAFLTLELSSCGSSSTTTTPTTVTVTIQIPVGAAGKGSAAYATNPLHLPVGSVVVWQNLDTMAHTATADGGAFNTGSIAPNSISAAVTFNSVGTFAYHCAVHPAMTGTIIVP